MVTYEVSATVAGPTTAERYERYMKDKHLRDGLASGCFVQAIFERGTEGKYRTRYVASTQSDVDRYLTAHTSALRADFAKHFPKEVQLSREVWTELAARHAGSH